jgi:hypothetical protein
MNIHRAFSALKIIALCFHSKTFRKLVRPRGENDYKTLQMSVFKYNKTNHPQ